MAGKIFRLLLPLFLNGNILFAQSFVDSNWYWQGGDYTLDQSGIYSFVPYWPYQPTPGARFRCAYWTDTNGNFWLFGGEGYGASRQRGSLNDLWMRSNSNRWAWIKGDNSVNQTDVYGTKGVSNSNNKPGGRHGSVTWTDNDGNLWLFGGLRRAVPPDYIDSFLNDLWKYTIETNEWTWINGDNIPNQDGVYGTMGVPDDANHPRPRVSAVGWKDAQGNLWLFGGWGYDAGHNSSLIVNDLWKYDIAANRWTWMKGRNYSYAGAIYGVKGIENAANIPGSRAGSAAWTDNEGYLWLWGGNGVGESSLGLLNDLWKYNTSTGNWTWMNGSNNANQRTIYGRKGFASDANTPGARESVYCWKDANGNFWLYGGLGFFERPGSTTAYFNDLWQFQRSTNQWIWMKGDTLPGQSALYNKGGVPGYNQRPGARAGGASWITSWGILYLFGGTNDSYATYSDFWMINSNSFVNLPIKLVHFTATVKGNDVNLQWQTENEVDFSHFNLQRSSDGFRFQNIAAIAASKQTGRNTYGYSDAAVCKLFTNKLFYRLQMVDRDGTVSFSNIITIVPSGLQITASNPVKAQLQLTINQSKNETIQISVTDMLGREVQRTRVGVQKGRNVIDVNVSLLVPGLYNVMVQDSGSIKNLRFTKQ
jgi:hypothetical protein